MTINICGRITTFQVSFRPRDVRLTRSCFDVREEGRFQDKDKINSVDKSYGVHIR
jgi:hypothetical protein